MSRFVPYHSYSKFGKNLDTRYFQQTACLVVNPIKFVNFAFHAGGSDFRLIGEIVGPALAFVTPNGVYLLDFFCSGIQFYLLLRPYLCFISFLYHGYMLSCTSVY